MDAVTWTTVPTSWQDTPIGVSMLTNVVVKREPPGEFCLVTKRFKGLHKPAPSTAASSTAESVQISVPAMMMLYLWSYHTCNIWCVISTAMLGHMEAAYSNRWYVLGR